LIFVFRVINVVKKWIENFYDTCFADDVDLKAEFFDFVDTQISVDNDKWANMLKELFREKVIDSSWSLSTND